MILHQAHRVMIQEIMEVKWEAKENLEALIVAQVKNMQMNLVVLEEM